jgi:hypothetical protein
MLWEDMDFQKDVKTKMKLVKIVHLDKLNNKLVYLYIDILKVMIKYNF